jgi:hypothetical protein
VGRDAFVENLAALVAARLWHIAEAERDAWLCRLHFAIPRLSVKDFIDRVYAHMPDEADCFTSSKGPGERLPGAFDATLDRDRPGGPA